jgi:hypothetical protein
MYSANESRDQAYWRRVELLDEDRLLLQGNDGIEARTEINVGSDLFIERGSALFLGIGTIIFGGKDIVELNRMTFYSRKRLRVWAESRDPDDFMDVAAYLSHCNRQNRSLEIGGVLSMIGVPEMRMEYVKVVGPGDSVEESILDKRWRLAERLRNYFSALKAKS